MFKRLLTLFLLVTLGLPLTAAAKFAPDAKFVYKTTDQRELELYVFYPNDEAKGKNRTVVISYFGGGWQSGSPDQFYSQSEYFASLGMVAISVDYRTIGKDKTTPFESVMDAKSAVRWVRENKKMLGINPDKVVTSGGSAGGHLAACTALIEGVDEDPKQKVSAMPNAMILFNPVVNTTAEGYGADKLVGQETELSPVHHVRPNLPPTLVMHGTQDTTVPFKNAVDFTNAMKEAGNDCTLIPAFGENHGFFNSPEFRASSGDRNFKRSMYESVKFLARLGFVEEDKIPQKQIIRVACVGNSITFGSRVEEREKNAYPVVLQGLLGDDYEVVNFGKPGATLLNDGNLPYTSTKEFAALVEFAPDVLILKLGTNDSKEMNWKGGENNFAADFESLIKSLRPNSSRSPQIFICSPVPAFTPADSQSINSAIIKDQIVPLVESLAKKNRAAKFIDLYTPFEKCESVFPDKIHPNAEGARRMAMEIYNAIAGEEVVTR
ncbi:MAG: GDSL-type esterase/lipase family protein [Rikenellaceae bacterium]